MASPESLVRTVSGRLKTLALSIACLGLAETARADPCHAIPDNGGLPGYLAPGTSFSGPVVYVGDGDSLCVGVGPAGSDWVEVRLADFYAPELSAPDGPAAKRALEGLAMRREVSCVAEHQSYDRIVARCELDGRSLGDLLRTDGGPEGGRGYSGAGGSSSSRSPIAPSLASVSFGKQPDGWMIPAAAFSAAAAVGVLYVGFKPHRRPRGRARWGGEEKRWRRR